jgi:NADH-quinone oxidoreductase subunit J
MPPFLYIFLGAIAIVSALGVIVQRNPVHCLLALISTLLAIAILFIGEDAVVVGFLQVIVYAGAIMVLFLFVIWLLNLQTEESGQTGQLALKLFGSIGAALLVTELVLLLAPPHLQVKFSEHPAGYGSIGKLAGTMFTSYLVAFEVTSVLLLAAVVGSVALARRLPAVQDQTAGKTAA